MEIHLSKLKQKQYNQINGNLKSDFGTELRKHVIYKTILYREYNFNI